MEVSAWGEAWYSAALCGAIQLFVIFPSGSPCGLHSLEELAFCVSYQSSPTLQARKKPVLKSLPTARKDTIQHHKSNTLLLLLMGQ